MAKIRPFKGILYNREIVREPASVITPPYDVIGEKEQEYYYSRSPYNIIRLEYGRSGSDEGPGDNRYTRAAATFQQWFLEKALIADSEETFYIYRQSFDFGGETFHRTGIIAALRLEPYTSKVVLPHEETHSRPKSDRLDLLRSCRANFSPIFGLFPDPESSLLKSVKPLLETGPLLEIASDDTGQGHRIWAAREPALQRELIKLLDDLPVFIADGHHRYETALHYAGESDSDRVPGCAYILANLVCLEDPGLVILPTHRLLKKLSGEGLKGLYRIIEEDFQVQRRETPETLDPAAFKAEMEMLGRKKPCLGLITPGRADLIAPRELPAGEKLDVSVLQRLIIMPLFSKTEKGMLEQLISYTHDTAGAVQAVISGEAAAAFILNPTPMDAVTERSLRGEIMPQKSTYFYPKLPSGLVILHHELSFD